MGGVMKVPREFGTEDPLRDRGWLVVCGVKVGDSRDKQREALMYLRSLIDKKLQEFGGEKGHTGCAEEAVDGLPSPSPSPTGERESLSRAATKANDCLLYTSPSPRDR